MSVAFEQIGRWSPEFEFEVEADRTRAYAAATDDANPRHLSGELAPPIFAVVPVGRALGEATARLMPRDAAPNVPRLHGEQDIIFHRPIRPGMRLRSRAVPLGVQSRSSGTTLVVKVETRDEAGELVNEQYWTPFIPGYSAGRSAGEAAPEHRLGAEFQTAGPVASIAQRLADDQTFRYAEASGDRTRFHLDAEYACSLGLPGIIVHGLCTMAFAGRAVIEGVADGDPSRLKRLAVRFSRPVLPGETITTHLWAAGERAGRRLYLLETVNPAGEAVLKYGLAEVGATGEG